MSRFAPDAVQVGVYQWKAHERKRVASTLSRRLQPGVDRDETLARVAGILGEYLAWLAAGVNKQRSQPKERTLSELEAIHSAAAALYAASGAASHEARVRLTEPREVVTKPQEQGPPETALVPLMREQTFGAVTPLLLELAQASKAADAALRKERLKTRTKDAAELEAVSALMDIWERATGELVVRPRSGATDPAFYPFMRASMALVLPGFNGDGAVKNILKARKKVKQSYSPRTYTLEETKAIYEEVGAFPHHEAKRPSAKKRRAAPGRND